MCTRLAGRHVACNSAGCCPIQRARRTIGAVSRPTVARDRWVDDERKMLDPDALSNLRGRSADRSSPDPGCPCRPVRAVPRLLDNAPAATLRSHVHPRDRRRPRRACGHRRVPGRRAEHPAAALPSSRSRLAGGRRAADRGVLHGPPPVTAGALITISSAPGRDRGSLESRDYGVSARPVAELPILRAEAALRHAYGNSGDLSLRERWMGRRAARRRVRAVGDQLAAPPELTGCKNAS